MVLFVSDMHFGRGDRQTERHHEAALLQCLRHHEARTSHLVLLGDVFDQYIEYRHLVPKGGVRLLGLLADWVDAGRRVTYVLGNHDPWHLTYFHDELGVQIVRADVHLDLGDTPAYLAHGDQFGSRVPLYAALKAALRHPAPVWLYRNLLPADLGARLARGVLRRIHTDVINPAVIRALREKAHRTLTDTPARLVVMGHSHVPEIQRWPEGVYVNTGCWRTSRTLAILDESGIHLLQWNGSDARDVESPSEPPGTAL
ncbi:MAG: UDP-2,3-diacylglucosamine diphosphatase [Rhodothermales bacterium]|nr:UDP-2,3-diacylglucosamine diphosphatase [Rhodothermales bacterium]